MTTAFGAVLPRDVPIGCPASLLPAQHSYTSSLPRLSILAYATIFCDKLDRDYSVERANRQSYKLPVREEGQPRNMPRLGNHGFGSGSPDHGEEQHFLEGGRRRVRRVWDGFIDFAFQGNVLEIAFGLMCVCHLLVTLGA